jgi:serine/threonine-protein kinase
VSVANGTVIANRYEIIDRIADGGMSTVYRARRRPDGLLVALKILRPQFGADRDFIERFAREARSAEALQHPNIVRVYESGREDDVHFIAMEYVDGLDLKGHLRRVGRLEPVDAERIARAVCEALEYAHRQGIIHRDVKPQNILIASDGTVKVADFGIARALAAVTITQPGTVLGTVQYLSPEQARGAAVGRASDLYALGAVLYEMLTGRVPFEGDTPIAIALKHLHDPPPRPRAVQPGVPVRLEGIVVKAMAKPLEERYRSARDMASDLDGATAFWKDAIAEDLAGTRAFDLPDEPGPRLRLGRTAVLAAAAALMVLIGGGWAAWQAVVAYLTVPEVEMPDLAGAPLSHAETVVREVGLILEVTDRVNDPLVPPNVVISQDQPPGKRLKQGRQVGVVVSLGAQMVAVPNLLQRPVQDAQLALEAARLKVGALREGYDEMVPPGAVISQDPLGGTTVPVDTPVTLVISRGPPLVEMPNLLGRPLDQARRLLEEKGLVVAQLRTVGILQVEPGTVIEQSPSPGARVRAGEAAISLAVSARPGEELAPPRVPVITAQPEETPTPPAPTPRPTPQPTPALGGSAPTPRPTPEAVAGNIRRTRVQIIVPEGGVREVRIVVIDETGVHTVYREQHAPGARVDQTVRSQGYTIIQVYIGNQLVQEIRP